MHRRALIELLERHAQSGSTQRAQVEPFLVFVRAHPDCLSRTCIPGHVTASAWILSPDGSQCLLTHHRKLSRWLQLGGHVDGEEQVQLAALREAVEESGMQRFELLSPDTVLRPLDLDVHPIPSRGSEPRHLHWDVRFLLRAGPDQPLCVSAESNALRWIDRARVAEVTDEESVLRLERAASQWLQYGVTPIRARSGGSAP